LGFDADYLRGGLMLWKNKTLGLSQRRLARLAIDRVVEHRFVNNITDRGMDGKQFLNGQALRAAGVDHCAVSKFPGYERSP
jgi:hypothetical protein